MKTLPAICRCCLSEGCTKPMFVEYVSSSGTSESIADIFKETLNIQIEPLNLQAEADTICDDCIHALTSAQQFRQNVLNNQLKFVEHWNQLVNSRSDFDKGTGTKLKEEPAQCYDVKTETEHSHEQFDYHYEEVHIMEADDGRDDDFLADMKLSMTKPRPGLKKQQSRRKRLKIETDADDAETGLDINISLDSITPDNTLMLIENSNLCLFHYSTNKYLCYVCKSLFLNIADLKRHTEKKHNLSEVVTKVLHAEMNKPILCDTSGLECKMCRNGFGNFANINALIAHLLKIHNVKIDLASGHNLLEFKLEFGYKCVVCSDGFATFAELHEHCMRHMRDKSRYMCDVCGKVFVCMVRLKSHMDNNCHAPEREISKTAALRENTAIILKNSNIWIFRHDSITYKCFLCNIKIYDVPSLKKHTKKHTIKDIEDRIKTAMYRCPNIKVEISDLMCNNCQNNFEDLDIFKQHLIEKHKIYFYKSGEHYLVPFYLENGLKCGFCKEEFKVMQTLIRHVNSHLTKVVCDVCGSRFLNEQSLKHHKHRNHKDIKCDLCDLSFDSFAQRKEHNKTHKNRSKKRYKCMFCEDEFTYLESRYKHMKSHHNYQPAEYKCTVCNRIYHTKTALATHTTSHAKMKSKPLKCLKCDLIFYKKNKLDEHMQTHGELLKYKCDVCENRFVSLNLLRLHLVEHNKLGESICSYCGKDLKNKTALLRHYSKSHQLVDKSDK